MAADSFEDPEPGASLDIGSVFSNALDELLSITGAQIVTGITLVGLASAILSNSLFVQVIEDALTTIRNEFDTSEPEVQEGLQELERAIDSMPLALDLSIPVIVLALLALALLVEAIKIIATRAFASDELDGVSGPLATRRLPVAALSAFVAGLLVKIAITITAGLTFFLLAIPALFIFIGTMLFRQEIAIGDKGPLAAIAGSWRLSKGNRWDLLIVAVVLFVIAIGIWIVTTAVPGTAGIVVSALLGSIEATFGVAVVTEAYVQLRGDPAGRHAI